MMGSVFVLLFFLLVVGLFVWCAVKPSVGRRFTRVFSVLAIGVGIGVLVWGICAAGLGESIRGPRFTAQPSEAIGWGAGTLAAGVTALVLSFIPSQRCP